MESDKHSEEAVDAMALRPLLTPGKRHPELMGCKRNAMHHSPKYKIPRSAMPQAAQEHGNDEIGILADFPLPVASQRNIKVIAQPAGKRNMPPPPKFRNGSGLIRGIEIDIEMEAQQQGNADSHITVTGEVAINLQGIAILFGAAVLLLLYTAGTSHSEREHRVEEAFGLVDWTTIFFFAGLFAIVYGLEEAGVLQVMGNKFIEYTDGSIEKAAMLVIWISAFVSTAIDNIPFVATMIPMIKSMEESMGGREAMMPVWWALSLGACYGGNGSLIAASANVIVGGMAQREGHPISFLGFLIWSIPTMLITVGIAAVYLHLRHFM